jgi:uncharacterized membrane protein (UPF0127 family)
MTGLSRIGRAALLTAVLALGGTGLHAQDEAPALDLDTFPRTDLVIRQVKPAQVHRFRVWVADTPQRSEQGLMFVRDLPENQGMVFPMTPPRVENMWMKNTYIELDMLFIDEHGRVVRIVEHARPLNLDTISSGSVVSAVLELRGGLAGKLGLKTGDVVTWEKPAAGG